MQTSVSASPQADTGGWLYATPVPSELASIWIEEHLEAEKNAS
jgi:hypothetical protein